MMLRKYMLMITETHMGLVHQNTCFTAVFTSSVLSEVDSLCTELLASSSRGFDPSVAVTRAVTNVVCTLVFSSTYSHGDSELQDVLKYNDGIVQTIARGGLVDIYPWMKVGLALGSWCINVLFMSLVLLGTALSVCVFQVFPSKTLSKLKDCITIRDRLLSRKLEEHRVR